MSAMPGNLAGWARSRCGEARYAGARMHGVDPQRAPVRARGEREVRDERRGILAGRDDLQEGALARLAAGEHAGVDDAEHDVRGPARPQHYLRPGTVRGRGRADLLAGPRHGEDGRIPEQPAGVPARVAELERVAGRAQGAAAVAETEPRGGEGAAGHGPAPRAGAGQMPGTRQC